MVAITCNVTVPLLGKDSFQEVDIAGITMPITKHNFIVKDVTKLADTMRRAFMIAKTGRPGPVLVDIPKDVTGAKCEYTFKEAEPVGRVTKDLTEEALERAVALIEAAKKSIHICRWWSRDQRCRRRISRLCIACRCAGL